ncbi:MAG TPA: hypothetical protein VN818_03845 [Gammaproteobacteria bacterium]|nr:hypothetical protein [Gammaproteobacteria bacterium]
MVISIGAAAFWIALAAVLISGGYFQFRRERLRQETLLRLVERTGQLDEQQIKAVFPPPPPMPAHVWGPPEYPDGRRILKVFGTIVLSLAAGLASVACVMLAIGATLAQDIVQLSFVWSALLACVGIGLFVAARFVRPPIGSRDRETS